jgi:hypothetical protein
VSISTISGALERDGRVVRPAEMSRHDSVTPNIVEKTTPNNLETHKDIWPAINITPHNLEPRFDRLNEAATRSRLTAEQDGVNKTHLLKYPICVPSEEEQREIVLRIKECFKTIESLASESNRAKTLIGRLDQATLFAAFRGELFEKASLALGSRHGTSWQHYGS